MATQRHIPLSDNHRRAITTTLWLLDERLCEFEQIAHGREVRSVLYHERNDLSAAERKRLLQEIARAHETIREIRNTLLLEPRVQVLSRLLRGTSSSMWETLVETQSKRLRGYGKVPRTLAQYLDPSLERLVDCVLNINRMTEGHKDERALDDGERPAHGRQVQQDEEAKS
jgi:hypothetical protein